MNLQFPPIIALYLIAATISWFVAYRAWQMRPTRGARLLTFTMLAIGVISFVTMLTIMQVDLTWRIASIRVLHLGVVANVYFWGLFTLKYSQFDRWYTPRNIRLLAIAPILIYLLVLTSDWHDLFFTSHQMVRRGDYYHFETNFGIGFWLWIVYAYTVVIGGAGLLIISVVRYPNIYRGQAAILVAGALAPLVFVGIFLAFDPLNGYDISPFGYVLMGVLILVAMQRFQFLNAVPVAYDLVFKSVRNAVLIVDEQGVILDMNPTAVALLNQTRQSVVGQHIKQSIPQFEELITNHYGVEEVKTEITYKGRFYELQVMPLLNRDGKNSGRIIILYDITTQKNAIQELDAYAHTVAHDLKNPLGIVLSFMELIRAGSLGELSEPLAKAFKNIDESSQKMQSIIDSLLMLATVRNAQDVRRHRLDTAKIVDEVLNRLAHLIEEHQAQITTAETWHVAQGYEPWVEEVWINFMSNAIKYGGNPPIIELGSDKLSNGHIRYWVKDNGAGLTPDEQVSLFVKTSRLEQHADLEGHGLGLSIVGRIIQKLDGTVGVESAPGQGSLFYFTLPEAQAESISKSA